MKVLLTILCGLMVLFAGGCAVILFLGSGYNGMFQSFPFALAAAGVAALNVLVILALFGSKAPQRWAFYVLAALDVIVIAIVLIAWTSYGFHDSEVNPLAIGLIAGFGLKALLTVLALFRGEIGAPPAKPG